MDIQYNSLDYVDLLHTIAKALGTRVVNNTLTIPSNFGKGYAWAENFPNGMSLLVCDVTLSTTMDMIRESSPNQFYILQFNEGFTESGDASFVEEEADHEPNKYNMNQQVVLLTNSFISTRFIMPANIKIKSIKIIFEKRQLIDFLGNEMFDELMGRYFSELVKNRHIEPVDAEYRSLIDELLMPKIDHPLRSIYITNRVMLLLERFAVKFMNKMMQKTDSHKLNDDEITRLMRVETLLVKDYTTAPPTIEKLSRISAMSPTKLKRDFKAMYGMPIYEYFQKNRMIHAKKLLTAAGSNVSIKEIGMMVGYSNLGHFAAAFRKEFGMLPSEMISQELTIDFEAKAV